MLIKYEVRLKEGSIYFDKDVDAVKKSISLMLSGVRSKVYKIELLKNDEECIFVPTTNPDDYKNIKF